MLDFQHWPEATGFLDYLKKTRHEVADVGSTPYEALERAGSMELRKYPSASSSRLPLLILPSVINRSFVLDLLPEKSLVRHFMAQGHDVYLIDWGIPQSHEQHLSFENLITLYVDLFLKRIELDSDASKLHLLGHCLGGTMGLILSNLYPQKFASLSMLTAPVSFTEHDKLSTWARHPEFDVRAFLDAYGNVPWVLLQTAFIGLKPTQLLSKGRQFMAKAKDPRFLRNFWALESWSNDNVNLRGGCYQMLLQDLYKDNLLQKNQMRIRKTPIDLQKHQLPTLVLVADHDHIVPTASHLTPQMTPQVQNFEVFNVEGGHVGALLGGQAQKAVWPKITAWMRNCEVSHTS